MCRVYQQLNLPLVGANGVSAFQAGCVVYVCVCVHLDSFSFPSKFMYFVVTVLIARVPLRSGRMDTA